MSRLAEVGWMRWTAENWQRAGRDSRTAHRRNAEWDERTERYWPVGTPEWRKRRPVWEERELSVSKIKTGG